MEPTTDVRGERPGPIDVLEMAAHRLRSDQRLGFDRTPFRLAIEEGTLEIDADVSDIAIKKRALKVVAVVPGVLWVVDRLRVVPAESMGDGEIRDHVVGALLEEPAFLECSLHKDVHGRLELVRAPAGSVRGDISVIVEDGVVTLDGEVPTRAHERLAGVIAWWVPGTRDVVDVLGPLSRERDNDEEITDAVRTALEKDPFLDATQVRAATTTGVVTLTGLVGSESQRDAAEHDAWYVFGVADVVNAIDVRQNI